MNRGHIPLRRCVACRARLPKRDLIRFCVTEGRVEVTEEGMNPRGRGCYVCPNGRCFELSVKKGLIVRALGRGSGMRLTVEDIIAWARAKGVIE